MRDRQSRNRNQKRPYGRPEENTRNPIPRILIVCEGKKTEPEYFKALRRSYRIPKENISVADTGDHSAPVNLLQKARAISQRDEFDCVYCVFDKDSHKNFDRVCNDIRKEERYETAESVPCFELWFLLHFESAEKPYGSFSDIEKDLKKHIPCYTKSGTCFSAIHSEERLANAIRSAKRLEDSRTHDPNHNRPYTRVHDLVEKIIEIRNTKWGAYYDS